MWSYADLPVPVPETMLTEVIDSTFATLKANLSPASSDTQPKKGEGSGKGGKSGQGAASK